MKTTTLACFALLLPGLTSTALAVGVSVGNSSLIDVLDYSDRFTITGAGGAAGRPGGGAFPVNLPGINVESNWSNPAMAWTNALWSIAEDGTVNDPPVSVFVGSGAGTATGMTQTGGGVDYGIEYGLANQFVVQFDAFQVGDRIDITAGASRNNITSGLSVFFRTTGSATEIGLYNGISEINSGLTSGIAAANAWHNYAVRFDIPGSELEVFVDEVSRGVVNLATLNGGTHNTASNAAISVGGTGTSNGRTWTDNFQVGTQGPAAVGTMLSLSTDVLNEGLSRRDSYVDGYNNNSTQSTVELVRFIPASDASPLSVQYTQNPLDTLDVSQFVVAGPERGAAQELNVNGYVPIGGSDPVGTTNLYLRGEPNVNNEGFGAHANWIVTFDLDDIRANLLGGSSLPLNLTGEFGAWGAIGSTDTAAGIVQGVVFLDGVRIDSMAEAIANPNAVNQSFDLDISSGRWLTFGIFNGDGTSDSTVWDDGLFQNVKLTVIPEPSGAVLLLMGIVVAGLQRNRRGPNPIVECNG